MTMNNETPPLPATVGFRCKKCGYLGPVHRDVIGQTLACPSCSCEAFRHEEGVSDKLERIEKENAQLCRELEGLQRWKSEMLTVMKEWDRVGEYIRLHSSPGCLGKNFSDIVLARLQEQASLQSQLFKAESDRDSLKAHLDLCSKYGEHLDNECREARLKLFKAGEEKTRLINDITALQTECDHLRITRAEFKKKVTDVEEESRRMRDLVTSQMGEAESGKQREFIAGNVVNEAFWKGCLSTASVMHKHLQPLPQTEGREEKPLREKSDECPFEVPAFKAPPKKNGKHVLVWWSWHPNYPYWSKSCWGGKSVEDALEALNSDFCSSMHYYHNVLVNDETMEVVHDAPCHRMDIWRKYTEAPAPVSEKGPMDSPESLRPRIEK